MQYENNQKPNKWCRVNRIRTDGHFIPNEAIYQLIYYPVSGAFTLHPISFYEANLIDGVKMLMNLSVKTNNALLRT